MRIAEINIFHTVHPGKLDVLFFQSGSRFLVMRSKILARLTPRHSGEIDDRSISEMKASTMEQKNQPESTIPY
jgi:hypothetical protein